MAWYLISEVAVVVVCSHVITVILYLPIAIANLFKKDKTLF